MDLEVEGFTPLEVVGRGGSATVYRARQDAFDREVALKVFDVEFGDLERERFVRELRSVGRLGEVHHAVALVFATGVTAHNRPYIAMRYYPGGSLQAAVKRSGPVSVEDALVVAECVGGALDAAHGVGILHRDVKPANVLLDGRQLAVLADFGVAGFVEAAGDTSSSVPMMTPAYAAPERFEGESATVASDVYSFAATLWSILAGHVPHATTTGDSISTIMHRILKGEIQALDRTDVPPHIELALRRALERDPAVRPSTAGELVAELAVGMGPSAAVAPRSSLLVVPSAMDTSAEIDTPESLDEQTRIRPSGIAGGIPPMPSPPDEATGVSPLAAPRDGARQSVLAVGVGERSAGDVSGEPSSRRRVLLVAAALFGVLLAVGVVVSLAVRDNGDGKVAEGPTSVPGAATTSIGGVDASSPSPSVTLNWGNGTSVAGCTVNCYRMVFTVDNFPAGKSVATSCQYNTGSGWLSDFGYDPPDITTDEKGHGWSGDLSNCVGSPSAGWTYRVVVDGVVSNAI